MPSFSPSLVYKDGSAFRCATCANRYSKAVHATAVADGARCAGCRWVWVNAGWHRPDGLLAMRLALDEHQPPADEGD